MPFGLLFEGWDYFWLLCKKNYAINKFLKQPQIVQSIEIVTLCCFCVKMCEAANLGLNVLFWFFFSYSMNSVFDEFCFCIWLRHSWFFPFLRCTFLSPPRTTFLSIIQRARTNSYSQPSSTIIGYFFSQAPLTRG